MISLKHIKNGCVVLRKIIKLKFSSKDLSNLINISLAHAGSHMQTTMAECDMTLV